MHAGSINTYRLRKIQKRRQKKQRLLMAFLILLFLVGIFIFVFYSKIFIVEKLIISNNNLVLITDIYKKFQEINHRKLFRIFDLTGNLLFWSNDLCSQIKEFSPAIENINCQKNFLNKTIKISVKERETLFLFYDEGSNQYFHLDKEGVLFYQTNCDDKKNLILIYNKGNNIYRLGDKLTIDFEKILNLNQIIQKELDFKYFELSNQDIIAVCSEGFKILINLNKLSETIKFIPKLLESNFDFNNLEYLDLRFLPKIYYK